MLGGPGRVQEGMRQGNVLIRARARYGERNNTTKAILAGGLSYCLDTVGWRSGCVLTSTFSLGCGRKNSCDMNRRCYPFFRPGRLRTVYGGRKLVVMEDRFTEKFTSAVRPWHKVVEALLATIYPRGRGHPYMYVRPSLPPCHPAICGLLS